MSRKYNYPASTPLGEANDELNDLWRRMDALEAKQTVKVLAQVGATETAVRHPLGRPPQDIHPVPRSDARVWQTRTATETTIYLAANIPVLVDVYVS